MRTATKVKLWAFFHILLLAALVAAVAFLAYFAFETNQALCTFKQDLQVRYDNGVQFLVDNPEGIPGISAADIQRSLSNQRATLEALSDLNCR